MAEPVRATPLAHRSPIAAEDDSLRLHELPFSGKHILRADHRAATGKVSEALGLGLPVKPLTSTRKGDHAALWLGPDEWLLLALDKPASALAQALAGDHAQLTEVSDFYTAIAVEGANARFALSKLTTLDLHPRAWRAGMVGGSLFGQASGWLWLVRDTRKAGAEFRLFVRWSHADYVWCLLAEGRSPVGHAGTNAGQRRKAAAGERPVNAALTGRTNRNATGFPVQSSGAAAPAGRSELSRRCSRARAAAVAAASPVIDLANRWRSRMVIVLAMAGAENRRSRRFMTLSIGRIHRGSSPRRLTVRRI